MILAEFRKLLLYQLGPQAPHVPQELDLALKWALEHLATLGAKARGSRLLYSTIADLSADKRELPIPPEVRTIKGVDRIDFDPPRPLTQVSFVQRQHAREGSFYGGLYDDTPLVYWLTHRTLHIEPAPSATDAAKLRIWFYGVPPLPQSETETVPIPPEAERYVIVKAAQLALPMPPPELMQMLDAQAQMVEQQLSCWFLDACADVPPNPALDGGSW